MSEGPFLDHNLNRLHQGTARIFLGNPPVSYEEDDAPSSETINANITGFIAPGLELKYETDGNYMCVVQIPVSEDNGPYSDKILSIDMICDDRQENYWSLHRYMQTIQSGDRNGFPITDEHNRVYGVDGHYGNRRTWIPRIDIIMADDSYQKHQTIRFSRCFPVKIEDLKFTFGAPDPVTFSAHFIYTMKEIIREIPPTANTTPIGVTS
jgi:hypothetical protein